MSPQSGDTALCLENGFAPEHEVTKPSGVVVAQQCDPTNSCSGLEDSPPRSTECGSILLGQVLSALIAVMSMSAASLDDRGVSLPSFVNFVNYSTIMAVFFFPMLITRGSLQLSLPWWRYALYALVDVEANTMAVLAFRYTSITSVTMLDAFSIPAVMALSRLFLRARYTRKHLMGVMLCLSGLALTVASDLQEPGETGDHPHALKGDMLCILGATMYAGANVMQEDFVKNHDRVEFLGMAGVFGVLISGIQTLYLEREAIANVEWTQSVVLFTVGYALSLSIMYSWTSLFLQAGDAAMFNLSLLTSDVYALTFAVFVEHASPNWLYFVAFAVIFCGLTLYHSQPAPTQAEPLRLEIDAHDDFAMGVPGEENWNSDCRRSQFFELRESSGNSDSTYCGSGELSDSSAVGSMPPSPNYADLSLL